MAATAAVVRVRFEGKLSDVITRHNDVIVHLLTRSACGVSDCAEERVRKGTVQRRVLRVETRNLSGTMQERRGKGGEEEGSEAKGREKNGRKQKGRKGKGKEGEGKRRRKKKKRAEGKGK